MLLYWNLENANFSKPEKNHDQLIQVRWSRERSKKGRKWLSRNRCSQKKVQCRSQVGVAFAFFCHILKNNNKLSTHKSEVQISIQALLYGVCWRAVFSRYSGILAHSKVVHRRLCESEWFVFLSVPCDWLASSTCLSPKVSSDRLQFTLIGTTEDKLMAIPDFIHKVSYSTCPVGGKRTNNMIKASQNFFYKQIGILQNWRLEPLYKTDYNHIASPHL